MRGDIGWVGLAAYIFLWDKYAPESLSSAFWRGVAHPRSRPVVIAAWLWVTTHLLVKKPRRLLWWW